MGRFDERLGEDRVIVGDGGTGAFLSAAVPRLRCPEEANLQGARGRDRRPCRVHPGRRGADRDEYLRRQPPQAPAQFLDDRLEEIVELGVKLAREARDVAGLRH